MKEEVALLEVLEDKTFLLRADEVALKSSEKTKVGACLVKDNKILSEGYNRLLSQISDPESIAPGSSGYPLKDKRNTFICHAEVDAIFSYNGPLANLYGATLYINIFPCHECAKTLIRMGIKEIVYKEDYRKVEICDAAKKVFDSCNIAYRKVGIDDDN